jgi:S1/P1 Nuclease
LDDFSFVEDTYDVIAALKNLVMWLQGDDYEYKTSYYYQQVVANFPTEAEARSFALRLVIHYVGDIHQPLHTTSQIDSEHKSGDEGGNFEKLPDICGASNLHSVWDSVAYSYCGFPELVRYTPPNNF